jgi:hypothetical protein
MDKSVIKLINKYATDSEIYSSSAAEFFMKDNRRVDFVQSKDNITGFTTVSTVKDLFRTLVNNPQINLDKITLAVPEDTNVDDLKTEISHMSVFNMISDE